LPEAWDANANKTVKATITAPKSKLLEPVSKSFQGFIRRKFHKRSIDEDERIQSQISLANTPIEDILSDDEEESAELLKSDPKDWKDLDHYAVMGLSKYRYKATIDQVHRAFKKKALKHHPDKKASSGSKNHNDDAFFKCIQKSYDILTNAEKRRHFDSVDPEIPDTFPKAKAEGSFFELWTPVFEREGRFSKKQPVPVLGDDNSTRQDVEDFYDFFFNLDSWRTFEYLDEKDTEGVDNRDDKRYLDRKNKAERDRRKKEDNARLRKLVETAMERDHRIQRFKEEERTRRNAKRLAKEAEEKAAAEEKARKEEEERKLIRKEKKAIKEIMTESNYFLSGDVQPAQLEAQLAKLDQLFEKL
ncbi:DnaJ-domain-containing protein, partial [Conidiobolus coronatus NRRL 28638]